MTKLVADWLKDDNSWVLVSNHYECIVTESKDTFLWKLDLITDNTKTTIMFPSKERAMAYAEEHVVFRNKRTKKLILWLYLILFIALILDPALAGKIYLGLSYAIMIWLTSTGRLVSDRSNKASRLIDCLAIIVVSPITLIMFSIKCLIKVW